MCPELRLARGRLPLRRDAVGGIDEAVPDQVTAKLRLENRASGKHVTVVDGLPDNRAYLDALCRDLKKACGTGRCGRSRIGSSCRETSASGSASCSRRRDWG